MSETANISVLHVDDEPDFAELAADMLEREDDRFSVATATSAAEGLERLAADDFDCIVSDYDMPGKNGIEFLESVREEYPNLPFTLFTGKGSEDIASEAISAGVTDYLQKDSGTEQYELLANRICNAVERTRAQRDRQRHLNAIETAQEGVSILDDDGEFIYVNNAYADLYGYDPDDLLGEHWAILYQDDDTPQIRNEILPTVEAEGYWHGETTGVRADGSTFVEDHTLALTDAGELICTVRDITDQRQREQAIEALHSTAQAFMEATTAEEVAEIAVEATHDLLDLPRNGVYLYDEEQEQLAPVAWTDQVEAIFGEPPTFAPDEAIAWTVFETGETRIYNDVSTCPERYNPDTNVRSEIILPLGGHGVLIIGSGEPDAFDVTDVDLARTLAAHATTAIDRVDREQALREYKTLVETVGDPMFVLNDDGTIQMSNDALLQYLNADEPTIIGTHASEFMTDEKFEQGTDLIEELLDAPDRRWETYEITAVTTTGDRIPAEVNLAPLTDEIGTHERTVGVIRDITERKEHEEKLTALHDVAGALTTSNSVEQVCERTIEASDEILDFDLSVIDFEEAGVLKKQAVSEDIPPENITDMPVEEGIAGKTYRTGDSLVIDDLAAHPDANPQGPYKSALSVPIGDHGIFQAVAETTGVFDEDDLELAELLVSHTESALDRLEREQELHRQNDRLDQFANVVSHDLRNPLSVAQGHLDRAREECDSDSLDDVAWAHDRMETLIDDLLTLARTGNRVDETEVVDIGGTVAGCWQTVETADATLVTETDRTVQADPSRLKQLLENLFRNAVEHGGDDVTVTVGNLDDMNGFYVADDGPGIPTDERDAVFEAGYSTTDEGTGFGLNIVREIVEAHGWEISVTDSENGGARFKITGVETAAL